MTKLLLIAMMMAGMLAACSAAEPTVTSAPTLAPKTTSEQYGGNAYSI